MENVIVLTGLYPSGTVHCDLVMRDFNQDVVVARVVKPAQRPTAGALMPVILQSTHVPADIKSRVHRRFESQQTTVFYLNGTEFTGRFVQLNYENSPVCDSETPAEIMSFVIGCLETDAAAG